MKFQNALVSLCVLTFALAACASETDDPGAEQGTTAAAPAPAPAASTSATPGSDPSKEHTGQVKEPMKWAPIWYCDFSWPCQQGGGWCWCNACDIIDCR